MIGLEETYPLLNKNHNCADSGGRRHRRRRRSAETVVVSSSYNNSSNEYEDDEQNNSNNTTSLLVVEEGAEQTCQGSNQRRVRSSQQQQRPMRPDHRAKEAIVYLGGMDHGKLTRFVSSRLAAKLNHHQAASIRLQKRNDPSETVEKNRFFTYKARGHFGYGKQLPTTDKNEQYSADLFEFETERHTIYLVEEEENATTFKEEDETHQVEQCEWPIVDVFQLDYLESLSGSWRKKRSLLVQTMAMAVAIVHYLISSISAFFRILFKKCCFCCCSCPGEGVLLVHVVQFSTIVFPFVLLLAYYAILFVAVGQILLGWMMGRRNNENGDPEMSETATAATTTTTITIAQQITVLATFAGVIAPHACHQYLVNAVADYTAVVYYLVGIGPLRTRLRDQLDALVERIQERWNYDRIHIVSYSFGALLAIDALFPEDKTEAPPQYKMVDHFITFGCPYDMVRTLLPKYYSSTSRRNRSSSSSSQSNDHNMRWTNFFVPGDALGSNFRNDSEVDRNPDAATMELERVPDRNIAIKPVAAGDCTNLFLDLISFCLVNGIRLHVKHWSDHPDTRDISNELVNIIFEDHWVLAEQVEP